MGWCIRFIIHILIRVVFSSYENNPSTDERMQFGYCLKLHTHGRFDHTFLKRFQFDKTLSILHTQRSTRNSDRYEQLQRAIANRDDRAAEAVQGGWIENRKGHSSSSCNGLMSKLSIVKRMKPFNNHPLVFFNQKSLLFVFCTLGQKSRRIVIGPKAMYFSVAKL